MYLKPNIAKLKKRKKELGWTNQRLAGRNLEQDIERHDKISEG